MADWENCPAVERVTDGVWTFRGAGAPLYGLYEWLAAGGTVGGFAGEFGVDPATAAVTLRYEADELHDCRPDYPQGVPFRRDVNRRRGRGDNAIWRAYPDVEQAAGRLGGVWVFKDSRFPLYVVYDNFAGGCTVDEFGEWYEIEKRRVAALLAYESGALNEAGRAYADIV